MITVRQNGKPRIVTCCGRVICEFGESGVAMADEAYSLDLVKLGYTVEANVAEEVSGNVDADGKAEAKAARSKRRGNSDTD